jgi:hypothetical protein
MPVCDFHVMVPARWIGPSWGPPGEGGQPQQRRRPDVGAREATDAERVSLASSVTQPGAKETCLRILDGSVASSGHFLDGSVHLLWRC